MAVMNRAISPLGIFASPKSRVGFGYIIVTAAGIGTLNSNLTWPIFVEFDIFAGLRVQKSEVEYKKLGEKKS